jgi:hypothetical protein
VVRYSIQTLSRLSDFVSTSFHQRKYDVLQRLGEPRLASRDQKLKARHVIAYRFIGKRARNRPSYFVHNMLCTLYIKGNVSAPRQKLYPRLSLWNRAYTVPIAWLGNVCLSCGVSLQRPKLLTIALRPHLTSASWKNCFKAASVVIPRSDLWSCGLLADNSSEVCVAELQTAWETFARPRSRPWGDSLMRRMPREHPLPPARSSRCREGPACWLSGKTPRGTKPCVDDGPAVLVFGTAPCMIDMDTFGVVVASQPHPLMAIPSFCCSALSAVAHAAGLDAVSAAAPRAHVDPHSTRWTRAACCQRRPSHGAAVLLGPQTIRCKNCCSCTVSRSLPASGVRGR